MCACNVCTEGQSLNLLPSGDLDLECMSMRNYILGWGGGGLEYAGSGYIGYGMCDGGAEGG